MNTLEVFAGRLTPFEWEQGKTWYARAHEEARVIGQLSRNHGAPDASAARGAAIIAALSPQTPWARNLALARAIVRGGTSGTFGTAIRRAHACMLADNPLDGLGKGPKVRAFADNIARPNESLAVTLDVWALRLVLDLGREGKVPTLTPKKYEALAEQYRAVAENFGVLPLQLQAATWVHIRGGAA